MSARRPRSSVVLALCLTACATSAPLERAPLTDEARRLVALLTLRRDEFSDLRAFVDVTIRRGTRTQRLSGVLLVKPPASLRFEALSPFGQPFLLLTISDGELTTYDVADNQALLAPANVRTTARWLGVPLDADEIVGLLIGRLPPPRELQQAEIVPADADGPSLRLHGRDQGQRIWMDFERGEILKAEIGGGRGTLVVTYSPAPGGDLPAGIHATLPGMDFDATVRYRQPAFATGLDAERFRLTLPEDVNLLRFH